MLLSAIADIHLLELTGEVLTTAGPDPEMDPDLLFLDVDKSNSFPDHFDLSRTCIVATAFEKKHAFRAFDMEATDFLLKPFRAERFEKCIARVRHFLKYHAEPREEESLEMSDLLNMRRRSRFVARCEGKIVFFKPTDISWIEADSSAVRFNVADGQSYRVLQTMQEVERKLDPRLFLRIHRSILVNIEKVRDVRACGNGAFMVTLREGKELPLGRSYRAGIERLVT